MLIVHYALKIYRKNPSHNNGNWSISTVGRYLTKSAAVKASKFYLDKPKVNTNTIVEVKIIKEGEYYM